MTLLSVVRFHHPQPIIGDIMKMLSGEYCFDEVPMPVVGQEVHHRLHGDGVVKNVCNDSLMSLVFFKEYGTIEYIPSYDLQYNY